MSIGPKTTVERSCVACDACHGEPYHVQGDSGVDVYCAHPSLPERKFIGDSVRKTPSWCPAASIDGAVQSDAKIAELESRLSKTLAERDALLKIVHFARRAFTSHDVHTDDDQLIALMNSVANDAKRWQFLMTEPDGFDMHVREYDDDGDEQWISCYPAADLEVVVDGAMTSGVT